MSDSDSVEALEFSADEQECDGRFLEELQGYIHTLGFDQLEEANCISDSEDESPSDPIAPSKADLQAERNKQSSKKKATASKDTPAVSDRHQTAKASKNVSKALKSKEAKEKTKEKEKRPTKEPSSMQSHSEEIDASRFLAYDPHLSKKLLFKFEVSSLWFLEISGEVSTVPIPVHVVKHLEQKASQLLANDVQLYEKFRMRKKKSDVEWLKTVMTTGTLSDKTSARVLLVQESPVHNIAALDALLVMCRKKIKRESIQAIDMVKELCLSCLLPPERKLKSFGSRPLGSLFGQEEGPSPPGRDCRLMLWYVEGQVKSCYREYISVLETCLHDPVANIKIKASGHVYDLLAQRPEQEQLLLSMLVNKLGDPDRKVASRASMFLIKLVMLHQNMSSIVVKEVESILYRPNVSKRAQYYAICFLNQLCLRRSDSQLASHLVRIYFVFFKALVQKESFDAKMLSALLTGVNRAFPYTQGNIESFEEHMDTLFKAVHVAPLSTGIQSLMLLFQVMDSRQAVSDRYYRALYSKLLDRDLCGSPKQAMFLNVVFKSLKTDPELSRTKAFLKRIFQVCGHHPSPFVCGCLVLVSEVLKSKPSLKSFILSPEEENDEEHFSDVPLPEDEEELGLEARADKEKDTNAEESHTKKIGQQYQGLHRNPLYCGAEHSCLWELERLSQHYHPSVQIFAQTLLKGDVITYPGNPLQDFTLIRFLDRFTFKNPKQKESDHGGSIMQNFNNSSVAKMAPATSPAFAALDEKHVRDDERYLHNFFRGKQEHGLSKKKKEKTKDSEEDIDSLLEKDIALDSVDIANEFDEKASQKGKNKMKQDKQMEESDDSDEDEDEEEQEEMEEGKEEFSYDEFDFEAEEEDPTALPGESQPSQQDLERVLLENMTDSEEDSGNDEGDDDHRLSSAKRSRMDGKQGKSSLRAGKKGSNADMFAAAEDFSHILEESGGGKGYVWKGRQVSEKQLNWEDRRGRAHEDHRRGGSSAGRRGTKRPNSEGNPRSGKKGRFNQQSPSATGKSHSRRPSSSSSTKGRERKRPPQQRRR